jgi:hypothetical protein
MHRGVRCETRGCFQCYKCVMTHMRPSAPAARLHLRRPTVALATAIAVAVPWLTVSPAAMGGTAPATAAATTTPATTAATGTGSLPATPAASATLTQCATATIPQNERAATFSGEMTAIPGTARMEIRIGLEERIPGELEFRTVTAPGLGVWHSSAAGVKIFTHIQQVTNLSAPAFYRGVLRFRWLNDKGHTIKSEELRTARCEQPAAPTTGGAGTGTTGTTTAAAASSAEASAQA